MKQFTDQRVDSTQFAHKARTQQVEQQIAMLVSAIKRAARNAAVCDTITLSQYDKLIVSIERKIRQWSVTRSDQKNYEGLVDAVSKGVAEAQVKIGRNELESLNKSIEDELSQLKEAQFQIT